MDSGGQCQSLGITLNLFATTVFWSVPFVRSFYGAPTFFISQGKQLFRSMEFLCVFIFCMFFLINNIREKGPGS